MLSSQFFNQEIVRYAGSSSPRFEPPNGIGLGIYLHFYFLPSFLFLL
uniref:Uncharacterized protein n=1 Tax=Arundo donax TaxID=35708 RepID=A0A0A9TVC4_ARUDO